MADWFTINDSQLDPDAPLTSELAYAWRDNPIAIAEGAPDAPRVMPKALASARLGSFRATGTAVSTITNIEWVNNIRFSGILIGVGGNNPLQVRFSTNNGSSWGGWQDVVFSDATAPHSNFFDVVIERSTGNFYDVSELTVPSSLTVPAAYNAIGWRRNGGGVYALHAYADGGRDDV